MKRKRSKHTTRIAGYINKMLVFTNPQVPENAKVWFYYRTANNENGGLELQHEKLLCYANGHRLVVVGESSDVGSGLAYDRNDLHEMLTAVQSGMVDAVLVRDYTRIGRNMIQTYDFIEREINAYRVVVLPTEN